MLKCEQNKRNWVHYIIYSAASISLLKLLKKINALLLMHQLQPNDAYLHIKGIGPTSCQFVSVKIPPLDDQEKNTPASNFLP